LIATRTLRDDLRVIVVVVVVVSGLRVVLVAVPIVVVVLVISLATRKHRNPVENAGARGDERLRCGDDALSHAMRVRRRVKDERRAIWIREHEVGDPAARLRAHTTEGRLIDDRSSGQYGDLRRGRHTVRGERRRDRGPGPGHLVVRCHGRARTDDGLHLEQDNDEDDDERRSPPLPATATGDHQPTRPSSPRTCPPSRGPEYENPDSSSHDESAKPFRFHLDTDAHDLRPVWHPPTHHRTHPQRQLRSPAASYV